VSRETLDKSVTTLVRSGATFPDPTPGMTQWRAAKGGVFTASVSEIVDFVDKTLSGHGPN
jgi:hypothetical protein